MSHPDFDGAPGRRPTSVGFAAAVSDGVTGAVRTLITSWTLRVRVRNLGAAMLAGFVRPASTKGELIMIHRKLSSLVAAPLLVAGIAVAVPIAGATAANAAPHGCYFEKVDNATFKTTCKYGPGQQRVVITCKDGITGSSYTVNGPWKQWYQSSQASCAAPWRQNASLNTVQVTG
ncbi:hypothetical protein [Streptomyces sp. BPTC-684]|uniref:hypothetical protein n=1 Tax=Streptomyces sp. BPTC-684 TaxID=3043734 RepID=UPI0024B11945|nr:hypothetical protein [Streptomyces sp. BPTC-684]WHM41000.1 hypothetical protein QIY60_31795 [Streptomyces sp. BPTC-684]